MVTSNFLAQSTKDRERICSVLVNIIGMEKLRRTASAINKTFFKVLRLCLLVGVTTDGLGFFYTNRFKVENISLSATVDKKRKMNWGPRFLVCISTV